jgi:protein-S-isoprenylcysteine O-methyltransferase Ste14
MLLSFLGSGLVLGSWWSLLPLIPAVVLMLRRTRLEDRYLREHLEGYDGYAERVRFRLLPGVW